jgi:hypothetical protein
MDRLSQLHHGALESLLERVFSELSPPGRWDRLERLELDLGTLQASDLEQQLPQRLEAALRRALAARLPPSLAQPLPPETSPAAPGPAAQLAAAVRTKSYAVKNKVLMQGLTICLLFKNLFLSMI